LIFVAYESELATRASIALVASGGPLPDMPLSLEPSLWVLVQGQRALQVDLAVWVKLRAA
jgi:hypothetical protein